MDEIRLKLIRYSMFFLIAVFIIIVASSFLYRSDGSEQVKRGEYINEPENSGYSAVRNNDGDEAYSVNNEEDYDKSNETSQKSDKVIFRRSYLIDDEADSKKVNIGGNRKADTNDFERNGSQNLFGKAELLRSQNKFESAVYEYEKIAENSADNITKSKCYEEIANTYISIKRYNSAIPYAEKSFNLNSTERVKNLLMDLYVRTGHKNEAEKLTNIKIEEKIPEPQNTVEQKQSEMPVLEEIESID